MAGDTALTKARQRLRQAIDRACIARGEAQWTNGYRAGGIRHLPLAEDERLYRQEMAQFRQCAKAEATTERAMRSYAAVIRKAARKGLDAR